MNKNKKKILDNIMDWSLIVLGVVGLFKGSLGVTLFSMVIIELHQIEQNTRKETISK